MANKLGRFRIALTLLQKSMLAYGMFILIPAVLIGLYTYSGYWNAIRNEVGAKTQKSVYQITQDISSRMDSVNGLADILASDWRIRNFLYLNGKLPGQDEQLYHEYIDSAEPLLTDAVYLHSSDVYRIVLYVGSAGAAGVTERGDLVLGDNRLNGQAWHKRFLQDSGYSLWMYPGQARESFQQSEDGGAQVFTLVQKIMTADGNYLGLAVFDIKWDSMLASAVRFNAMAGQDSLAFAVDDGGAVVYSPAGFDPKTVSSGLKAFAGGNGTVLQNGACYSYQRIAPLGVTIVCRADMRGAVARSKAAAVKIMLVFLAGVVILIALTYVTIKTIYRQMNRIVSTMSAVARGELDVRIPVERRDEVGRLAEDFNTLIDRINDLIRNLLEKETAQKDAQLLALQYQINPHFIYNMIDAFRMRMVLLKDNETAEAITDFGKILRYNISSQSVFTTIREEIDIVEKYIRLQKFRFQDRLVFSSDVPEQFLAMRVIKFMLQPVVENSIRHGFTGRNQTMNIRIRMHEADGCAVITVADDGSGIDAARLKTLNDALREDGNASAIGTGEGGIGLSNINNRLKLYYGSQYFICVRSEPGRCTETTITIPQFRQEAMDV